MTRRSTPVLPADPATSTPAHEPPSDVITRLDPVILRTFAEEDFHRVDMRSIAREAGMSFRTIYRYFVDKEVLLFWFISYWLRDLYPDALRALDTDESTTVRLQKCLLAHLEFYQRRPDVGRVIFMTVPLQQWMRHETYRADASVKRLLEVIREGQACGEIRSDCTPVQVLDAWSGVFNRAFLMWEFRKRSYSLTGQWQVLCEFFLHGVAGPGPDVKSNVPRRATRPKGGRATGS